MSSEIDNPAVDITGSEELADGNKIALNTAVGRRIRSDL